ncbi:hypothetical protein DJ50_4761 [Bacillus cereus ATCC 10876]|nr:hypothetical protein DJ50_4761 [Bacillus cereus ATCC 10876]SUY93875.1 Phage protein [Bacillus cereus]
MKINREAFDEFNLVCNDYFEKDANKNVGLIPVK